MKTFPPKLSIFSQTKNRFQTLAAFILLVISSVFLFACKPKVDYFDYVSELRSNIFLAQTEEYILRIYSVKKETPYESDGIPKELTVRTEVYFLPNSGDKTCNLSFTVNGKTYGGEMSFDNVKAEYYFSCSLDSSALTQINCSIDYGNDHVQLNALSVLSESTLSANTVLAELVKKEAELFSSLTDKYGFAGEIYMRLIFEDSPYYYVGVIDREQNTYAFLINAENGNILAKRHS